MLSADGIADAISPLRQSEPCVAGPTGREISAQGFGRRPMPWVHNPPFRGLKGRESFQSHTYRSSNSIS